LIQPISFLIFIYILPAEKEPIAGGMEQEENIYEKIQELLGDLNGNFNVLEEQISIDTQLEYFEFSTDLKKTFNSDDTFLKKETLFSSDLPIEEKKTLLVHLASVDKVEAYRVIEQYQSCPDPELKDWATMAFQESKMLMESSLLDQNQVFISTGLGGKGSKLSYFVVFIAKDNQILEEFQKNILRSEIEFAFRKKDSVLENINYSGCLTICKMLIPIKVQFNLLFEEIIEASNQLGDFLDKNYLVTNVKELSLEEITDVLNTAKTNDQSDSEEV
jgi:hypothetical protein